MHKLLEIKSIRQVLLVTATIVASFYIGLSLYQPGNDLKNQTYEPRNFRSLIESSIQKDLTLTGPSGNYTVAATIMNSWLESFTRDYSGKSDIRLSFPKIEQYLQTLAKEINRPAVDAKLNFENGRAQVFVPESAGLKLDTGQSAAQIAQALINQENSANLAIELTEPSVTLEKINRLGITDLIGKGESDFGGSPTSRIHNIRTSATRYNGLIVAPGEEFSFNQFLGDVEASTGYKAELVIKSGKLVYEYGGGICQVSTTLFRAAINSGLPILERRPHSFPVRYYNPQGFDSTVYPGVVDLKFKNDTPNHILIQSKIIKSNISFEIYGTKDGRVVTMDGPYQFDQKPDGSMKAYFTRTVALNGEEKKETFRSTYKPPVKYEANPLE